MVGEHQAFHRPRATNNVCMVTKKKRKTKRKREQAKRHISYTKKSVVMKKHVLLHILITKKREGTGEMVLEKQKKRVPILMHSYIGYVK